MKDKKGSNQFWYCHFNFPDGFPGQGYNDLSLQIPYASEIVNSSRLLHNPRIERIASGHRRYSKPRFHASVHFSGSVLHFESPTLFQENQFHHQRFFFLFPSPLQRPKIVGRHGREEFSNLVKVYLPRQGERLCFQLKPFFFFWTGPLAINLKKNYVPSSSFNSIVAFWGSFLVNTLKL